MYKKLNWALCLVPALCCFAVPAGAGADMTRSATGAGSCFPEIDPTWDLNITYCMGTMAGIRNQIGDRTRFAYFAIGSSGVANFTMVVNGVGYSCAAPSTLHELWRTAMSTNGWFHLGFDRTTGVCKFMTISGGSNQKVAL
jgi:hypothetical protein